MHDVAWPHPRKVPGGIPLSAVLPLELPLDELLDPELPELPELLDVPPLEPELLDVTPELLPFGVPEPLLPPLPPLLATPLLVPLLPPTGWTLFIVGVVPPLAFPLVSTGGGGAGVDDVQPKIETATNAAVPRLIEFRFFISDASRTVGLLDDGDLARSVVAAR